MSVFTSAKLAAIRAINADPTEFRGLDETLRGDYEVALEVVRLGHYPLLQYATETLLMNREFIMACVVQDYKSITCAHELLKNDKQFMSAYLKKKGVKQATIKFIPESLMHDRDFNLAVLKESKEMLRYAPEELKTDKNFLMNALRINGMAIEYVSGELRSDPEIILTAVGSQPLSIRHIPPAARDNEHLMMRLITLRGEFSQYASDRLRANSDFMVFAFRHYRGAYPFTASSLRDDKTFNIAVLHIDGLYLELLPFKFQDDIDCVSAASRRNYLAFQYASRERRSDRAFIKQVVIRIALILDFVPRDILDDDEFMLELIRLNGLCYTYASNMIRSNREVVVAAMRQTGGRIYWQIDSNLRDDPEIMAILIENFFINPFENTVYRSLDEVMSEDEMAALTDMNTKCRYLREKVQLCTSNPAMFDRLRIQVRRDDVLEDSFQNLNALLIGHRKYCPLNVIFEGESAVDAGGLTREFFSIISNKLVDPSKNLFKSQDNVTFQPDGWSSELPDCDEYFKFIGRLVGKAIANGENLDSLVFTTPFLKHIIGAPITIEDLKYDASSQSLYNSLKYVLDHPAEELGLQFTHSLSPRTNQVGNEQHLVQDLKDLSRVPSDGMGSHDDVTDDNKGEFVHLKVTYCTTHRIERQLGAFLDGVHEFIPRYFLSLFSTQELALLINGQSVVDLEYLQSNTVYENGYSASDEYIQYFWQILAEETLDIRRQFLLFVTGSTRVPSNFRENDPFKLHLCKLSNRESLPVSHTCHRQLNLPQYSSKEELKAKLLQAIQEGGAGFDFL